MSDVTQKVRYGGRARRLGLALPLLFFAVLAGLFWYALHGGDPSRLPSALLGKPVPVFTLPPLEGLADDGKEVPGFASTDLAQGQRVRLVLPRMPEENALVALANRPGIRLFGIDYKDDAAAARRFLGRYGNPYSRVGADYRDARRRFRRLACPRPTDHPDGKSPSDSRTARIIKEKPCRCSSPRQRPRRRASISGSHPADTNLRHSGESEPHPPPRQFAGYRHAPERPPV